MGSVRNGAKLRPVFRVNTPSGLSQKLLILAPFGSVRACVQNAQQFGLGVNEKGRNSVSVDGG